MNDLRLKVLDIITDEYKKKKYSELNEIGENGIKFYNKYENQECWVEIFINKKVKDILRVMINVEFNGNWMAKARYFGKTKDDKVIENEDMVF